MQTCGEEKFKTIDVNSHHIYCQFWGLFNMIEWSVTAVLQVRAFPQTSENIQTFTF